MSGPSKMDDDYRSLALAALENNDWHGAYQWAKGWIGHGGAGLLDPWLVYVASALLHGQPRTATHSVDLALQAWFPEPDDRGMLHLVRSRIIWKRLRDPKTAVADHAEARRLVPQWLRDAVDSEEPALAAAAAGSRKRKPSVSPAPRFSAVSENSTGPAERRLPPGTQPDLWTVAMTFIDDRPLGSSPIRSWSGRHQ